MKLRSIIILIALFNTTVFSTSCNRKELLNEVPTNRYNVLSTLDECRQILDKEIILNTTPVLNELSSDFYYIKEDKWEELNPWEKNTYTWAADIFGKEKDCPDWSIPYEQVYYANVVLDALETNIPNTDKALFNQVKGWSYFVRAHAFYNLSQVFCLPYDNTTAVTDLGIPLRLQPYPGEVSKRATVKQTYEQVITDLKQARLLLPLYFDSLYRNRPSALAAMAMLARVYLTMGDYPHALLYADSCLENYQALIDFNMLDVNYPLPFRRLNAEAIYQTRVHSKTNILTGWAAKLAVVDSSLLKLYDSNDLRRIIYFDTEQNGTSYLKGSYYGAFLSFSGIAMDEVYLVRAECYARAKNTNAAMNDIHTLLQKRYKQGTYFPYPVSSPGEALDIVLQERRKELVSRGLRWTDIRRLNNEGANIVLKRYVNGQMYELQPNNIRYALPIPSDVINITGMQQNPR